MSQESTLIFTVISGFCTILLFISFIHFLIVQKRTEETITHLVKKFAIVSLFGYTTFVFISFILYCVQLLWHMPFVNIYYSSVLCQLQTFNIAFFMMGKLAMYLFFMSLVYFAFRDSFLAYSAKIIVPTAILFFFLMCIIGGFYMTSIYFDFVSVGAINSPTDCQKFKASQYTQIIIWSGATCDAIWSCVCLLLFYLPLRKLTKLLHATHNLQNSKGRSRKKKRDVGHELFPFMLKLTILSFWCAVSTLSLGFSLWTIYPTVASIIDSTINAACVYLSFSCNDKIYRLLCIPFISCKYCRNWRIWINESKTHLIKVKSSTTTPTRATSTTTGFTTSGDQSDHKKQTKVRDDTHDTHDSSVLAIENQRKISVTIHATHVSMNLNGIRTVVHNEMSTKSTLEGTISAYTPHSLQPIPTNSPVSDDCATSVHIADNSD